MHHIVADPSFVPHLTTPAPQSHRHLPIDVVVR